ncbi:MAG: hypothetical protein KFKLKKLM_02641 [Flavobacteriales bacterium]|nr:hypothetical protein [Flavobacteriales bacterium]
MSQITYYNIYPFNAQRGFADYLRSVYANFCIYHNKTQSDFNNTKYEILFNNGPLRTCFKELALIGNIKEADLNYSTKVNYYSLNGPELYSGNNPNHDSQLSPNINYQIMNNYRLYNVVDPFTTFYNKDHRHEFINFIEQRLSDKLKNIINDYYLEYYKDKHVKAIHIRTGDYLYFKNPDIRITIPHAIDALNKIINLDQFTNHKLLLFTDSQELKDHIKNDHQGLNNKIITFNNKPTHVASNNIELDSVLYTIAEFFFFKYFDEIYVLPSIRISDRLKENRMSTFPLLAAYLYDRKILKYDYLKNEFYEYKPVGLFN